MLRRPAIAALAASLTAVVLPPPPVSYGAAARADLVVAVVTAPGEVRAGATLTVRVTTQNTGRARSAASTTRIHLSADVRGGNDVATATVRVPRLAPRKRHAATVAVRVPAGAEGRSYRVLACADVTRKVREGKEGNNCRVAARAVTVETGPDSEYPRTPNPLSVTSRTDDARAVSQMAFQHESTTITTTGGDGTTYELEIPAGALVAPEQVTMTPVLSVGGLPLSGGLAAAVELEPHGLVLLKPATLTIEGPDLGPVGQQTPFYFHGGGDDFHLYPPLPPEAGDGADVVRLPILHFSTPGMGLGNAADRDAMSDYPTSRLPGQITGEIAEVLRQEREDQLNGEPADPDVGRQVITLLTEYYYAAVKPKLVRAEANPRDRGAAFAAINEALGWLRQMQLFGIGDDEHDATEEMQDAMARVLRVAEAVYQDAVKQCFDEHGLEALPILVRLAQTAQVLGFPWGEAAYQKFQDCARFEVRFDSRVSHQGTRPYAGEEFWNVPHTATGSWRAQATSINALTDNAGMAQVALPLTAAAYHSEYSFRRSDGSICNGHSDQTGSLPGTLHTTVLPSFVANPREVPPGEEDAWQEPVVELLVMLNPTGVKDTRRHVGCDETDYTDNQTSDWLTTYQRFHTYQLIRGSKADRSGDLMYAQTWENSASEPNHLGSVDWQETTVLEVWHKPAA